MIEASDITTALYNMIAYSGGNNNITPAPFASLTPVRMLRDAYCHLSDKLIIVCK